jgi:Dimerisation domain
MTQQNKPSNANVPPPEAMLQMISGFWISRSIYIAAKLGIADHLRDQPKSADELAAATGTHAPSLYRVLRALSSVGVFAQDNDNHFRLTPLAETLRTDVPGSKLLKEPCPSYRPADPELREDLDLSQSREMRTI